MQWLSCASACGEAALHSNNVVEPAPAEEWSRLLELGPSQPSLLWLEQELNACRLDSLVSLQVENIVSTANLGDLIEFSYPIGYSHWAVYDQDGYVLHFAVAGMGAFHEVTIYYICTTNKVQLCVQTCVPGAYSINQPLL